MRVNNKKYFAMIQNIVRMFPLLFILAMFILHPALPDKTFSKEERRYLAQWPVFHIEKVLDGSYETKVESYFSEQFPFRSFWVHIQKGFNQILFNLCRGKTKPAQRRNENHEYFVGERCRIGKDYDLHWFDNHFYFSYCCGTGNLIYGKCQPDA